MKLRKGIIILLLCLLSVPAWGEDRFEVTDRQKVGVYIDSSGDTWYKDIFVLRDNKSDREYLFYGQRVTTGGGTVHTTQFHITLITELKEREDENK